MMNLRLSQQLRARHKENKYLLNKLYVDFSNSTTYVCNSALAALYNVSEATIACVRGALDALCEGLPMTCEELEEEGDMDQYISIYGERKRNLLQNGTTRYAYSRRHPMNRYSDEVRERVEKHLDMVVRADPMGENGDRVGRVYDRDINTFEKLREKLNKGLCLDNDENYELSESTLQRMIAAYMGKRNYTNISFAQSDHNACPNCKSMHCALLEFEEAENATLLELEGYSSHQRPLQRAEQERVDALEAVVALKKFQQAECAASLDQHTDRDKKIRAYVKQLSDYFFAVENGLSRLLKPMRESMPFDWNSQLWRGLMTHQDDMTKVDLPHFVQEASSDITRWRFDVNAHVNTVTSDVVVLSHEQGMGAKNASLLVEEILLEHLLSCCGQAVKVVISDNASVGKNWLTTVALPQYIVDQGLAKIAVIAFLENNHGKFLADMLFGQFQTRKRRQMMFGVDDLLSAF